MLRRALQWTAAACGVGIAAPWDQRFGVGSKARAEPLRLDYDDLYTPEIDEAIELGLEFLVNQQQPDGGFRGQQYSRNVAVIGLAGLAFLSNGGLPGRGRWGRALEKCVTYIVDSCEDSGFIVRPGTTGHGPMYGHGFAALFLAEVYGVSPQARVRDCLKAAIDLIVRCQGPEGGWRYDPRPTRGDLSVTVCQVMALRAARNAGIYVPAETIERALDYVRRSQNPDGGFMYQITGGGGESRFALTAAAVVALYSVGQYSGKELEQAIRFLQERFDNDAGLYRNGYYFYAHYYSVQAFWILGGDAWQSWYRALSRQIMNQRYPDGRWEDMIGREYATAMACIILSVPRSTLPIFQR
jgi:prenyltransferase beta subunit